MTRARDINDEKVKVSDDDGAVTVSLTCATSEKIFTNGHVRMVHRGELVVHSDRRTKECALEQISGVACRS